MAEPYDDARLMELEGEVDGWLASLREQLPQIAAVDRGADELIRWYVRLEGEEKDYTTIWFTLGQRTLRYETFVMPAPDENHAQLYEHLLRRNERLVGAHFSIGDEDAVFLRGEVPVQLLSEAALDDIIGTVYATVETTFQSLLRIGFASRFR